MRALVAKELQELARERRFAAFLVAFSAILGAGSAVVLHAAEESRAAGGIGVGFADPVFGLLFVGLVSCVLLALTFAADAVAKERDQGMLPLLLTAPVTHAQVLGAKAVALAVVYAGYALVNLAIAAILAAAFGLVVLKATFWLLLLPLGAFYVFLCGTCLLLSALFRSSKAAVATAVAAVLPLFLLIKDGPVGYLLRQSRPALYEALSWSPVEAAIASSRALASGAPLAWGPLAFSALLGVGLGLASYLAFRAREAAL